MAVTYESKRFPVSFILSDIGGADSIVRNSVGGAAPSYPLLAGPRNGSLATSTSMYTIIENEHWLAMADPPMVNFLDAGANGLTPSGAVTSWFGGLTYSAKTIKVIVPPFCRWASFHFLCSHDFGGDPDTNHHIKVESAFHTAINPNIPWGEELTGSGKSVMPYFAADWVHFQGIDLNETGGPAAVRLVEDATESAQWTTVNVTITPSTFVGIYAAAYRVLPAVGTMQVQT